MKIRKVFALCLSLLMVCCALWAAIPQARAAEVTPVQTEMYGRTALASLDNSTALLYAYDQLVKGIGASQQEISVYDGKNPISIDEISIVLDAYGRDHTYHFWLGNSYSISYNSTSILKVLPAYIMEGTALENAKTAFNNAADQILSGIHSGMTDYEKELYLHDQLAKRVDYVQGTNAHNAYGALVEGLAVCEGYAEALQYLLQRCGIPSFIIEGASRPPQGGAQIPHAWNAVKIGGRYYQVDVTWDDQGEDIYHSYFNITDSMILEDHVITDPGFPLPSCNSLAAFYFNVNGGNVDSYSVQSVGKLLKDNNGKVHVYYSGDLEVFLDWFADNIVAIAQEAGVSGGFSYSYSYLGHEAILQIPELQEEQEHTHSYIAQVIAPTCQTGGYTLYTCTICGDSYQGDETAPTDHVYSNDTDESCNVCGNIRDLTSASFPFTANEWEMLKLVNKARTAQGLDPLTGYDLLQQAGHIRAKEVDVHYGHDRPNGDSCFTVLEELGISYFSAGENIAQGQRSPAQVTDAWMNSPGHYGNIMDPNFAHATMGNWNYSWVQMFVSGSTYTGITVTVPEDLTIQPGMTIDEMNLVAILSTKKVDRCYLPVTADYCTGYDPNGAGEQKVTINVLGVSTTFTLNSGGHLCKDNLTFVPLKDSTCTEYGTLAHYVCDICGQTYGDAQASSWLDGVIIDLAPHTKLALAAVAPTCTEPGLTEGSKCSVCGEVLQAQEALPALGHSKNTVSGYSPTCTEPGKTDGESCVRCGQVLKEQETIPALGHDPVVIEAQDPDCIHTGLTEGSYCGRCSLELKAQEILPALGHREMSVPAVEPTCTSNGLTEGKICQDCGRILLAQQNVPALGHEEVEDPAKEPTCKETGLTEGSHCARCGEILIPQTVLETLPHTEEVIPGSPATCTATGLTEGKKCAACGQILLAQQLIPALEHQSETVPAVNPTCIASGLTEGKKCSLCGTVLEAQEKLPPVGHTGQTVPGTPATCTEAGLSDGEICTVCGTVMKAQTVIDAKGHQWQSGICTECGQVCEHENMEEGGQCPDCGSGCAHVYQDDEYAPDCTEQGYTLHTCQLCGYQYMDNFLPALGHSWLPASCVEPSTCTVCGHTEGEALGHDYRVAEVVAPTCTGEGYTRYTCVTCGDSYEDAFTEPVDHVPAPPVEENHREGTCIEGETYDTVVYCSVCGQELNREVHTVPAPGHSYTDTVTAPSCTEQGYTTHTCEKCGDTKVDSYTPATGHSFGEWELRTEPDCEWEGRQSRDCSLCGQEEFAPIAPLGHDWDGDVCKRCGISRSPNKVELTLADSETVKSVFVDGEEFPVTHTENGIRVELPRRDATNLVIYTYNDPDAQDVYSQYPIGMRVWLLKYTENGYEAEYVPGFDNLMQYSGSSIRVSGNRGIRMITSISKDTRQSLMNEGIAGYKLVEYGTLLAWSGMINEYNPMVKDVPYTRYNHAYKRGEADPIFKDTGDLIQYTNVLVDFSLSQCGANVLMRPYMVLENGDGQQLTLYGGTVNRSIGYVAWQNRNAFTPGTEAYEYVWQIIRFVYGDTYDGEYKG